MSEIQLSLTNLAEKINTEHQLCSEALQKGLGHAIKAGEYLQAAKQQCQHEQWLPWLAANCKFSERTAQNYMRIYTNRAELEAKAQHVTDLTYRDAVLLLAEPKSEDTPAAELWDMEDGITKSLDKFIALGAVMREIKAKLEPKMFDAYCQSKGFERDFLEACISTEAWYQEQLGRMNAENLTVEDCLKIAKEAESVENVWAELRLRLMRKTGEIFNTIKNPERFVLTAIQKTQLSAIREIEKNGGRLTPTGLEFTRAITQAERLAIGQQLALLDRLAPKEAE